MVRSLISFGALEPVCGFRLIKPDWRYEGPELGLVDIFSADPGVARDHENVLTISPLVWHA